MSSGPGALSRHRNLAELNDPLVTNTGILTPAQRKTAARENLGTGGTVAAPAVASLNATYSNTEVAAAINALRTALINAGVFTV